MHAGISMIFQAVLPLSLGYAGILDFFAHPDTVLVTCRDLDLADIVFQAVLPMNAEVEHLQVKALVAVLPVRLKILDVAGSFASVYTFEPQSESDAPRDNAGSASPERSPRQVVQKFWLIYRPGHYEIVYPAEGFEDLDKL